MGCKAFGDTTVLPPHDQAEESFEMRESSFRLVNASVDKWTELWEPLTIWLWGVLVV